MKDNYDLWKAHDREMERRLSRRPLCSVCENHIQDENAYLINGEFICLECMNRDFKIYVDDYTEEE